MIIRNIVARCHVGQSYREVIRYVIGRLRKPCWTTWKSIPRDERKKLLRDIVDAHRENRQLYLDVMKGGW